MQKRGGMDNENKFYNIYRPCRKEGAWTTSINIVEIVLVVHAPSFLHGLYIL
jgi:hypothetical protein